MGNGTGGKKKKKIHDVDGGKFVHTKTIHKGPVENLATTASYDLLSASEDRAVALYDVKNRREKKRWTDVDGKSPLTRIAYVHNSSRIVVGTSNGSLAVIAAAGEDGKEGSAASAQTTIPGERARATKIHDSRITGLCVPRGRDDDYVCTGGRDNAVCVVDIATLKTIRSVRIPRNLVTGMCSIDENTIAQVSEDLSLRVWDVRIFQRKAVQTYRGYRYFALDVAASTDGRILLTSSKGDNGNGCEGMVWDRRRASSQHGDSEPMHILRGHTQSTPACSFLNNANDFVLTASHDATVRVWDLARKGECVCCSDDLDDPIECVAVVGGDCRGDAKDCSSRETVCAVGTQSGAISVLEYSAKKRGFL